MKTNRELARQWWGDLPPDEQKRILDKHTPKYSIQSLTCIHIESLWYTYKRKVIYVMRLSYQDACKYIAWYKQNTSGYANIEVGGVRFIGNNHELEYLIGKLELDKKDYDISGEYPDIVNKRKVKKV